MGLNSNKAINAIKDAAKAMHFDAGYRTAGRIIDDPNTWKQTLKDEFVDAAGEYRYGKMVGAGIGGMIGLRAGFGALRGTFTDGNGNLDLPGIPGL